MNVRKIGIHIWFGWYVKKTYCQAIDWWKKIEEKERKKSFNLNTKAGECRMVMMHLSRTPHTAWKVKFAFYFTYQRKIFLVWNSFMFCFAFFVFLFFQAIDFCNVFFCTIRLYWSLMNEQQKVTLWINVGFFSIWLGNLLWHFYSGFYRYIRLPLYSSENECHQLNLW